MEATKNYHTSQDWLMTEFQFNEDDLIANRMGAMSEAQKHRAMRQGISMFHLMILLGVLVIMALSWQLISKKNHDISSLIIGGAASIAFIAVGLWIGWRSRKAGESGLVKAIAGKVRFRQDKRGVVLCIGDEIQWV